MLKKRDIRSSHKPFINNEISKAIKTIESLKNRFLQNRREENRKLFCKQRSKGVSLLQKSKKDYFENLNEKNITDNNISGKARNPSCQKKFIFLNKINLTEGESNSLLTNWEEIAKELNNFFANAVKNLNIPNYEYCDFLAEKTDDPTLKTIAK